MDLEQYKQFVEMQKTLGGGGGGNDTVLIISMVITALGSVLAAIASWISKQAATETKVKAAEIKDAQDIATEETKKIHIAVNSRDTASVQEIKNLNEKNAEMMKILGGLETKIASLLAEREATTRTVAHVQVAAVPTH